MEFGEIFDESNRDEEEDFLQSHRDSSCAENLSLPKREENIQELCSLPKVDIDRMHFTTEDSLFETTSQQETQQLRTNTRKEASKPRFSIKPTRGGCPNGRDPYSKSAERLHGREKERIPLAKKLQLLTKGLPPTVTTEKQSFRAAGGLRFKQKSFSISKIRELKPVEANEDIGVDEVDKEAMGEGKFDYLNGDLPIVMENKDMSCMRHSPNLAERFRTGLATLKEPVSQPHDSYENLSFHQQLLRLPVTSHQGALQRVVQLEKQRRAFLSQSNIASNQASDANSLDILILDNSREAHLTKCSCKVLRHPLGWTLNDCHADAEKSRDKHGQDLTVPENREDFQKTFRAQRDPLAVIMQLQVFFDSRIIADLVIKPGSVVRVHAPWRELHAELQGVNIILCTTYAELLQ